MISDRLQKILNNEKSYVKSFELKGLLFEYGLKERICEKCLLKNWLQFPIPLELHHINGNHHDNKLENLQILCSNCHSLEPTFTGGNKRKQKKTIEEYKKAIESSYNCSQACKKLDIKQKGGNYNTLKNIVIKYGFKYLEPEPKLIIEKETISPTGKRIRRKYSSKEEFIKALTKGSYPPDSILKEIVWHKSVLQLSKEYGVCDNSLRNRCYARHIPVPPNGYWRKLDVGKFKECDEIKQNTINKMVGMVGVEPTTS